MLVGLAQRHQVAAEFDDGLAGFVGFDTLPGGAVQRFEAADFIVLGDDLAGSQGGAALLGLARLPQGILQRQIRRFQLRHAFF